MQEWGAIMAAERAAGLGPADTPTSPTAGCLHRVEGAGLALLCSNDVEVRRWARLSVCVVTPSPSCLSPVML